ncbi:MAG TPA: hypothetical protein VF540_07875, partial [Segetibacter sp.]
MFAKKHHLFRSLIFFIPVCFLLASCASKSSGKKQIFSYNQSEGIATLDPAFAKNQSTIWAAHQLYNSLVETDSNLNIVPC